MVAVVCMLLFYSSFYSLSCLHCLVIGVRCSLNSLFDIYGVQAGGLRSWAFRSELDVIYWIPGGRDCVAVDPSVVSS